MKKFMAVILGVAFIILSSMTVLSDYEGGNNVEFIDENYLKECIILKVGSCNSLVSDINMPIDSADEEIAPFIENSTTMIPLQFLGQSLDMSVRWSDKTKKIDIFSSETQISFTLGSKIANVNGVEMALIEPVITRNGRSFLPLRFVSENMGYKVEYYDGIIIISKQQLYNEQIQFALELAQKDFNREETLTFQGKNGELKTLKFSHGKSVINEDRDFILVDKNMNDIYAFRWSNLCDDVIWDNNDGMIWAVTNYQKRHADSGENGNGISSMPPPPFNIGYYLYDNNGNYMKITASSISSFENGMAIITEAWTDKVVTIDTKGRVVK